jgi:hypothetical protein
MFRDKIEAIKKLRSMFADLGRVDIIPQHGQSSTSNLHFEARAVLGLREAKDFVEECMAYGVSYHGGGSVHVVLFQRDNMIHIRAFRLVSDAIGFRNNEQPDGMILEASLE